MEFIFVVYNIILLYIIFKSYKLSHHLFFILGKSSGLNSFGLMWCNGIAFIAPNFISNYAFQTYILPPFDFRTCLWTCSIVLDIYSG
jgi:hypothetical protein